MSDVAATQGRATSGRLAYAAIGFALASVIVWVLAGVVDDGLYTVSAVFGLAAVGIAWKARNDAGRTRVNSTRTGCPDRRRPRRGTGDRLHDRLGDLPPRQLRYR